MQFLIFALLTAIFHTASALPQAPPAYLDLSSLPDCARSCTKLLKVVTDCIPPTTPPGTVDRATYVGCFCNNAWLRSLNDVGNICAPVCDKYGETEVERYYGGLCGVSSPYVTLSSKAVTTSTPTLTSLLPIPTTTSTLAPVPSRSSTSAVEVPQDGNGPPESWAHKHWKQIVEGTLIPFAILFFVAAVAASYAWYTRIRWRRSQRPMTAEEMERYRDRLIQERLEELGLIPLQTVDNSLRGRLGLRASAARAPDPISNRRIRRRHDLSISTNAPLLPSSSTSELRDSATQRPSSARTIASSIGQRSISSPLSQHSHLAPLLPIVPADSGTQTLFRTTKAPQTPNSSRSFSFPDTLAGAAARSDVPYLPPVESLIVPSSLARSLRIYKEETLMRESVMIRNVGSDTVRLPIRQ